MYRRIASPPQSHPTLPGGPLKSIGSWLPLVNQWLIIWLSQIVPVWIEHIGTLGDISDISPQTKPFRKDPAARPTAEQVSQELEALLSSTNSSWDFDHVMPCDSEIWWNFEPERTGIWDWCYLCLFPRASNSPSFGAVFVPRETWWLMLPSSQD